MDESDTQYAVDVDPCGLLSEQLYDDELEIEHSDGRVILTSAVDGIAEVVLKYIE